MFVKQKGLKGLNIHQVSYPNLGIRRTSEWKSDHHHPHHNDTLILIIILMAIVILTIILIIIATGQWRIPKRAPNHPNHTLLLRWEQKLVKFYHQPGTIWRPLRRLSHSSLNTWVFCPLPPNRNEKTPIKVDKTHPPKSMETRTVLDLAIIATPQNTLHISCYTLPLSSSSGKWRFI